MQKKKSQDTISPADIDKLKEICDEDAALPEIIEEIKKVIIQFSPTIGMDTLMKTEAKLTFKEAEAIARRFLALADENERLRKFTEHALDLWSWDNEPDGGSIQDKAEELKLIELRLIDPKDSIDGETEHYFPVWAPKEGNPAVEK